MLLHSGRLATRLVDAGIQGGVALVPNADGPVQTLQFGDLLTDELGRVLNSRREVAYIVHQFDRKPGVVKMAEAIFPVLAPLRESSGFWSASSALASHNEASSSGWGDEGSRGAGRPRAVPNGDHRDWAYKGASSSNTGKSVSSKAGKTLLR